ncbi:MAG: phosphoesterase [Candidatus Latescibacteria bacterium]|nr:phosphoesterase [Candidatus Latescibacterota bacterium]
MHFSSSYLGLDDPCQWLRGNHHGHSTVSDGEGEPAAVVAAYEAAGYDYLALSEHDVLLDPGKLQEDTSLCLVPAVEVTSRFGQTLMYLGADRVLPAGELTPRQIMDQVRQAGGLFIFDHPNWKPRPDYAADELLDQMEGLVGMEIYCGVIERLAGEALATGRWDRLLSKGWRVWGHGTDDQHRRGDYFIAWNCVQWPRSESVWPAGLVQALATGRFYASTGVRIERVGLDGDGAAVVEAEADQIRWIGRHGVVLRKCAGGADRLTVEEAVVLAGGKDQLLYVRGECLGRGGAVAWTQPFWLEE